MPLPAWIQRSFSGRSLGAAAALAFACACAAAAPARSLRFEKLGLDQGLPQESVLNIIQDRQGFMWFGTQAGLGRYDGYRMTVYKNDPADPASINDNYVSASFEDGLGRLWFGTKGGLTRYDRSSQKFIHYHSGRIVSAIVGDGKQGLWLGTQEGLRHFDPASGSFTTLRHDPDDPASLGDNRVNALARGADGSLWVGTTDGLHRLAPDGKRFTRHALSPAAGAARNRVLALSFSPQGVLWVGTGAGLEEWKLEGAAPARRLLAAADGMAAGQIMTLYHDKDGNLWAGTDVDGLKWRSVAGGPFFSYRYQPLDRHSLSNNQIVSVLVDRTGTLWAGSTFGGANRADLASGGFERITHTPGDAASISSNIVRALAPDAGGRMWLGTTGGGLNLFDPETGKASALRHDPRNPAGLIDDMVTALEAGGGRLWVGTPTGLAWMDPGKGVFTRVPLGAEANGNFVQRLMFDRGGLLWVVTRGGVHLLDPGKGIVKRWTHDARDPGSLSDDRGFSILEDRKGVVWIGTDNGLNRYDPASGKFTHYFHDRADPVSLRHSRIYSLFESSTGQFWVGTAGGLHRVEPGDGARLRFRYFPLTGNRAADPIGAILEEDSGKLWISSTAGISRLDPASGQFKNFTSKDGLTDGSFFVGAALRLPNGRLSFGGINGMTTFLPAAILENPYPPVVMITDFLIFNRSLRANQILAGVPFRGPIQDAREITLTHRDSVLSLEFAALHFADPGRNIYAYQLEGFDQGWVNTTAGKRFATYTNLDPGNYVFRVRAGSKDGVWQAEPATLRITILPPVWKTTWFRALVAALVLTLGYALYHMRISRLVSTRTLLEKQVGARTAELQMEKESVERQKHEVEVAHRNISLLSEIGRRLTANLDSESIMLMLYEHVDQLMDASVFGIGVYRPEREVIDYPFAIERGKRYAPYSRSMKEPNQLAVWCIVNQREVYINDLELEYTRYIDDLALTTGTDNMGTLDDGSLPTAPRSLLYAPISVNGRMLGVVTVHSYRQHAYERFHLDMLRTLASYVAVAFDNADAYRQLQDTQAQLVAQEKLAALGSLVAGVAHELNTPIGNSLLMASTLQEKTEEMAKKVSGQNLRRSELEGYIGASQEVSSLIMRSLLSAADLVNSFKQVAVDQTSAQRRRFKLDVATHEIVATMMNQVRKSGHAIEVDMPDDIDMDSYPGSYGQVIINFINNAMLHAFDPGTGGTMRLSARCPQAGRVLIEFRDNGRGIAPEHQARIFDPFFTTKMGQGGSGLGLNISYNIVTSLLEGQVWVESGPRGGTTFFLDLPLRIAAAG
ncbi:MAG: two-component regulator propeller domain-containing protein [Pseudomonadota bacterium]